jgi:hypothetical protein
MPNGCGQQAASGAGQGGAYFRTRWLMLWVNTNENAAIRAKGQVPFIECIQWRDSRSTMVLTGRKPRGMTWPEWSRERLTSFVCRHLVDQFRL